MKNKETKQWEKPDQIIEILAHMQEGLGSIPALHKQGTMEDTCNSALGRWRQKDHKFKVILD